MNETNNQIIIRIHNILKRVYNSDLIIRKNHPFDKIYNLVYFSNSNSLDYYHGLEIDNTIEIFHTLTMENFNNFINELIKDFDIKSKSYHFMYHEEIVEFEIKHNDFDYKLKLIFNPNINNSNPLNNLFYDIYELKLYHPNKNGFDEINDLDIFINKYIVTEEFIEKASDQFNLVLELFVFYIKYKNSVVKKIIDKFVDMLKSNKKYRKSIRHKLEIGNSTNNIKIFNLLSGFKNNLNQWINLLSEEYMIFNKILYDIDKFDTYNLEIKTIEDYIILVFLNKFDIVTKDYNKYVELYINKPNENSINDFFIDKLTDFRSIKSNIDISKLDKYVDGLELSSKTYIKNCFHILCLMFYVDLDIKYNYEPIKLAYITKIYSYIKKDKMEKYFNLYNGIIKYLSFNNFINLDSYFYKLCYDKKILTFEMEKMCDIPKIRKNFEKDEDNININDFQDIFVLVYEFLCVNQIDLDFIDSADLEMYFESQLSNVRSNKLISIKKRKKSNDFSSWMGFNEKEIGLGEKDFDLLNSFVNNFDSNILETEKSNGDLNETLEEYLNDENEPDNCAMEDNETDINSSTNINDLMYRLKYERYKISYLKLKQVDKIFQFNNFDINILNGYEQITDELVDMLLDKYNMNINLISDTESEKE